MIRALPDDLPFDRLHIDNLSSYLFSTGWKNAEPKYSDMLDFTREVPGRNLPDLVTIPADEQSILFKDYMSMAALRLADIEETTPQEIAQKILLAGQDVIDLRLLLPDEHLPSLEMIPGFFQGLRNLVVYGACMEKDPRRSFERPFGVGREQTQHFQFARTFPGSFGFAITSSVPKEPQGDFPMQRRVLERITRGFLLAKSAEMKQDPEEISRNFEQGFNANMCKAVVDMLNAMPDTQLEYAVTWSSHLAPSPDVAQVAPLIFEKETASYLQAAAHYLQQTADKDLEEERTIEGLVINLNTEKPGERIVTLFSEEWGKVSFAAEPDQYAFASDANCEEKMINVHGKLTKGKRKSWILLHPHDLQYP